MATDPYHNFASELRSSLVSAQALASSYTRTLASGGATQRDAQRRAHDDLLDALEALQSDVQDVRASVAVVSKSPERFGLSLVQLEQRKRFVKQCEEEIQNLDRIAATKPPTTGRDVNDLMEQGRASGLGEDEPIEAFEREQQQSLLAKQDNTLNLIGSALTNLRSQASTLGQEIVEQVELVGQLDTEVDQSQSRLKRAIGRMDELARRSDERCGGWCVWLLVVALMFLLLLVILI